MGVVVSATEHILSIDPGGKGGDTGIVFLEYTPETPPVLLDSWAVPNGLDGFREWHLSTWLTTNLTVIVEQFVHFKAVQIETTPILIEGAVRFIWPNAVLSPASGKDTQMPDAVMGNLGFCKATVKGDHHGDRWSALKHALRWLKHQKHVPTLRGFSGV